MGMSVAQIVSAVANGWLARLARMLSWVRFAPDGCGRVSALLQLVCVRVNLSECHNNKAKATLPNKSKPALAGAWQQRGAHR